MTTANPPDNAATFQRWLAAQYHGEMGYLERNAYKRIDPDKVLSGARSVVTLAASYHREDQNTGPVAAMRDSATITIHWPGHSRR